MNNYKINPDYALPDGLAIGMEGRFWDKDPDDYVEDTLQGFYPDDEYKFSLNSGSQFLHFTPFKPWQPELGELVWFEDGDYSDLGRFKGMSGDVYRILVNSRRSLRISVIAKVYDIEKEFGMTIKEIIESRKPGDVLGASG